MGYHTMLVHVNDKRRLARLLAVALEVARNHQSHLIAASIVPPFLVPVDDAAIELPRLMEEHRAAYRIEEHRMKGQFDALTRAGVSAGAFSTEWRSFDPGCSSTAADVVMPLARSVDLIVCSQADSSWRSTELLDVADRLATHCGRPVLIVPNGGDAAFSAARIAVAWNGTREATRAAFDALPLLKRAREVKLLWIDPHQRGPHEVPAADLCAALSRHGVACEAADIAPITMPAGEAILTEAARVGADLLVMGCYGHSWLREFITGGATRHVLAHAKLPVLLSH